MTFLLLFLTFTLLGLVQHDGAALGMSEKKDGDGTALDSEGSGCDGKGWGNHLPCLLASPFHLLSLCPCYAIPAALSLFHLGLGLAQQDGAALCMPRGRDGDGRAVNSQGSRCRGEG